MYNDNDYYDFGYETNNRKSKFSFNNLNLKGKLIIGGIFIVILIIGIVIFNKVVNYYDSYQYFEKQMATKARDYIQNNNIVVNDEIYLSASKLGINMKDSCSEISGGLVDKNYHYQG